jgi:hypothetical protein
MNCPKSLTLKSKLGLVNVYSHKHYRIRPHVLNSFAMATVITTHIHKCFPIRPKIRFKKWSPSNQATMVIELLCRLNVKRKARGKSLVQQCNISSSSSRAVPLPSHVHQLGPSASSASSFTGQKLLRPLYQPTLAYYIEIL